jgi:hypothetical protein
VAIIFDGPNKVITLDTLVSTTVAVIYSRWKDWAQITDNTKFLPAFRVVGGDPLGGGVQAGINVFLRNDLGWRIRPPEQDIQIAINGNLYAEDPGVAAFIPTAGGFDTLVRLDLSANLLQSSGGGGSSSLTAAEVWDLTDGIEASLTPRQALRIIAAALAGKLSGAAGTTVTIRDIADTKDRIVATVDAQGNRTTVNTDGT